MARRAPPGRVIVPAVVAHAGAIAAVHVAAWRWAYADLLPPAFLAGLSVETRRAGWASNLAAPPPRPRTHCLLDAGRVIAFVSEGPSRDPGASAVTGEVLALYQHPDVAGTGVGEALLRHAECSLAAHGCTRATLWVLAANARGRRAYERLGWRADGHTRFDHVGGVEALHLRYERALGPVVA